MKLHYKLYLFFAGVVLLPLLVATIAASFVLGRTGTETYEGRIRSSLAAASAIISGQAQVLAGDFQAGIRSADPGALAAADPGQRVAALNSLMERARATSAAIDDAAGNRIAFTGDYMEESPPMLAASARMAGPGGAQWRVTVYRTYDADVLESVFSSQGLEWGLLDSGKVASGSLPPGTELTSEGGGIPAQAQPGPEAGGAEEFYKARFDEVNMLASSLVIPSEITSRDTVLFAAVRDDVVGAASGQALRIGLGLMLLVAILAATLGYMLARTITSPVRELNEAAAAGIAGNLKRRVAVRSRDELGSLADSFNRMQESIQNYITELEESRNQLMLALTYAGDILGSTTERDRLVKTTADAARLATGAGGIWVELFESEEPPGHEALSAGVPAGLFQGAGEVLSRMSRRVAGGRETVGEVLAFDGQNDMVVYPMVHGQKTLGVLAAVFDRGRPLEESRKKILGSLALQAASALENVNFGDLQRMLAVTDPMTGLSNFRYLNSYLERELNKSSRYGHQLTVAILDLDDFKNVNDSYGHLAGDTLLRSVAKALLTHVRGADLVARYGGEEFAVVFPETGKKAALGVAQKLRREIQGVRLEEYPGVRITASVGVASFPEDAPEPSALLARADQALYRSKEAGKNQVTAA